MVGQQRVPGVMVGDVVAPGLEVVDVLVVVVAGVEVVVVVVVVAVAVVVDDGDDEPPLHLTPPLEDLGVLADSLVPWVKRIYNVVYG